MQLHAFLFSIYEMNKIQKNRFLVELQFSKNSTILRFIEFISFTLLSLSWLLPNHYFPWPSFWNEALAAFAFSLLTLCLTYNSHPNLKVPITAITVISLSLIPIIQWHFNLISFSGDAWIASIYIVGFGIAIALPHAQPHRIRYLLGGLTYAALLSSLLSVLLETYQLLNFDELGIFLATLPLGARPFANLAQPNQLATLLMLGLIAACALHQEEQVHKPIFWLITFLLLCGITMTQSRTAWLEMGALCLWAFIQQKRTGLKLNRIEIIGLGAIFSIMVMAWPRVCLLFDLNINRSLHDSLQINTDKRWQHWHQMIDAIQRHPWFGYGWNQVSVAQSLVATDHPATGEMIEHSHNFLLDILIWNGLPLGVLIISTVIWWLYTRASSNEYSTVIWLLAGIGIVLIHSLLEYPMEYAYFLLPTGFMIGSVDVLSTKTGYLKIKISRSIAFLSALSMTVLLFVIVYDYARLENSSRSLRFELAGFGPTATQQENIPVFLLTQVRDYQLFMHTQARRNMKPEELEKMHRIVERYGYAPALFRYALASALNGQPGLATHSLDLLCHTQSKERCDEGINAWKKMASGAYPEISSVALPN